MRRERDADAAGGGWLAGAREPRGERDDEEDVRWGGQMTVFIALLRGINVGGRNRVRMADLVELCRSLGLVDVRTYLQSGNALFESPDESPAHLSAILEEKISRRSGFPVKVILRSIGELRQIIVDNPLLREGLDGDILHVTFLSDLPSNGVPEGMVRGEAGPDRYVIVGREVYLSCPEGYGRTKFTTSFFEKELGVGATTRNWKTVTTLADMAGE